MDSIWLRLLVREVTVQRATWSDKDLSGFGIAEGKAEIAEDTVRRALEMLSAPRVKAGTYTVIIDPLLCGVFAHEAFGHLSEADFIYENERMRETMHLGRRFGPPQLNIVDDASLPQAGGSYAFDDEGLPGRKNHLHYRRRINRKTSQPGNRDAHGRGTNRKRPRTDASVYTDCPHEQHVYRTRTLSHSIRW